MVPIGPDLALPAHVHAPAHRTLTALLHLPFPLLLSYTTLLVILHMSQLIRCGGCRFEFTSAGAVEAQMLGGDIGHGIGELWPEAVHLCLQCSVKCKTLYATQTSPSIAPSNQPDSLPGGASSGAAPPVTNSEGIKSLRFACEKEASAWARTQAGWFKSMPGRRRLYECAHKGCESRRLVIHDPKGGASEPWRISPSGECDHGDGDTDDTWAFLGPEARDRLVGRPSQGVQ